MANNRYEPVEGDTFENLLKKAWRCGQELPPNDRRAEWIDARTGDEYQELVEQYHAGQSEVDFD